MSTKEELRPLVGKKCWYSDHTLEIRQKSDAEIVSVDDDTIVIKHFLGKIHHIEISDIWNIVRKDI